MGYLKGYETTPYGGGSESYLLTCMFSGEELNGMCFTHEEVTQEECTRAAYLEARNALIQLAAYVTDRREFETLYDVKVWVETTVQNLDEEHPPAKWHNDAGCFCTGGDDFCAACVVAGCGKDGCATPCRVSGKVLPRGPRG